MGSLLPQLIEKQRIIFVDNVTSEFAQKFSEVYSNAVFFTDNQEIWKNGQLYSKVIGVDETANSITVNGTTYKLVIESNLLKFKTDFAWYWYVGGNKKNFDQLPGIDDKTGTNEEGWRFITNDEKIINNYTDYNPWEATFNPDTLSFTCEDGCAPLYNAFGNNIIEFNNKNFVNDETNIYLILPYFLVANYNIGLYDGIGETNFLPDEANYYNRQYKRFEGRISHGGVDYIKYKITFKKTDNITEPFKNFTLSLYAKPKQQ